MLGRGRYTTAVPDNGPWKTNNFWLKDFKMASNVPATDPSVYDSYKSKWSTLPDTAESWLARAREVSGVLAQDAAQRDQENKSPRAEIALLKHSGLLKLLGPKKYGGGEQPWSVGYQAIREVAKGDGYAHFKTLYSQRHS